MNRRQFLSTSAAALAAGTMPAAENKPNVIVILADDVGYGDLSCYGATKVKTPNLDRIAQQGLRFTDAHSSSATCTPTRYSRPANAGTSSDGCSTRPSDCRWCRSCNTSRRQCVHPDRGT